MTLPRPKSSMQEVLRYLIDHDNVCLFNFPYLAGFRTRISNLHKNYGLNIETEKMQGTNKYGNHYTYAVHTLKEKDAAIKLYLKLVGK